MSTTLIIATALAAILLIISRTIYDLFFHELRHIPGPKLNAISRIPYVRHHLRGTTSSYLSSLHAKYGDVVRYSPNEVSFISIETAWPQIYGFRTGAMRGHQSMQKDQVWFAPPPVPGHPSIIVAGDETHSRGRKILAHAFSEKALASQESLLQNYGDLLVSQLKATVSKSSAPTDMTRWYNFTTFDVISDLMFGEPFGCLRGGDYHKYVALLLGSIKAFRLFYVMEHFPWAKYLGSLIVSQKQLRDRAEFIAWVSEQTKLRVARDTDRPDFMTEILKHNDTEKGLDEGDMISNAQLMLAAGTETTATVLSSATYLLCQHKDILSKLQQEVRGRWKNYDDITLEQVNSAPYLLAVLSEALRIFPPVPTGFMRVVPQGGETVSGYFVPEGTSVCVSSHAAHHSARNFTDPDTFDPQRWLGDEHYASDKREWAQPFSFGPRACLGRNLAYAEMRLFLAKMVWTFDFELDERSNNWMYECKVMLIWQKPELLVKLKPVQRG